MTTGEIQDQLEEVFGVEVSPTLIFTVTDRVLDEVQAWQARPPLEAIYPIVFLDAIHVKSRVSGHSQIQGVCLALALTLTGEKELLGLWVGEAEGTKFWVGCPSELRRIIDTTDAVEGLNAQLREVTQKWGAFPTHDSVTNVMFLALQRASRK